jgi:hypothetical protein
MARNGGGGGRFAPRTPAWLAVLMFAEQNLDRASRLSGLLLEELAWTWTTAAARDAVTSAIYSGKKARYSPGGLRFDAGLFDWEAKALETAPFPRRGRILLTGAGGGREMAALAERGYEVVALEPCEALFSSAVEVARGHAGTRVVRASNQDLIAHGDGRLDGVEGVFDGVLLGWESFSYVAPEERVGFLTALHRLAPRAPVLLSFATWRSGVDVPRRVQRRVRSAFRWLRGGQAIGGFDSAAGFYWPMTCGELRGAAEAAGYDVRLCEAEPYPHAMLSVR